ncbi:MAG: hypothetical protein FWD95_01980 [Nocardioidaceae bacterium]|nr:hypothetical protein [Nocardioidaceae bacterium]
MSPHPYLADLPVFDAEVDAIAESVAEVGLLHPVTLDAEGRVIGGRHRLAACAKAGVEPTFETYDGDPLAFILHDNAARKHQTTGQRAAEVGLALESAGKRQNRRWAYGEAKENLSDLKDSRLSQCGLILDHLGRSALIEVANGDRTLNDAYTAAERARDDAEQAERKAAIEKAAEDDAREFVTAKDPELAAKVGGDVIGTYREAMAIWEQRNAEEVRKKRQAAQDRRDAVQRLGSYIRAFLGGWETAKNLHANPLRDEVLDALAPTYRDEFLRIEKDYL